MSSDPYEIDTVSNSNVYDSDPLDPFGGSGDPYISIDSFDPIVSGGSGDITEVDSRFEGVATPRGVDDSPRLSESTVTPSFDNSALDFDDPILDLDLDDPLEAFGGSGDPIEEMLADLGINLDTDSTGATRGITLASGAGNVTPAAITELAMGNEFDEIDDGTGTDFSTVFPAGESLTDDTLGTSPSFETQEEAIDRALREALGDDIPTEEQISPEDFRANEAALAGLDFETGLPLGGITPDEDIEKGGVLYESTLQSVKDRVSDVEGTSDAGGYDRLLGFQEGNFGVKPSEMTVAEVLAFQAKRGEGSYADYSKGVNKKNNNLRADGTPEISTPVGKYQVVGLTLSQLVKDGVVDPNEKFDEATQERIGTYLIENRGFGETDLSQSDFEKTLGKEFAGIKEKGYNTDGTSTSSDIPTGADISGGSSTDLYLSAMAKIEDRDPNAEVEVLTEAEQRALYGSRGQTPNAAETAYLQDLLGDAKHAEDGKIDNRRKIADPYDPDGKTIAQGGGIDNPNFGELMYEAGDDITPETFGEQAVDFGLGLVETLYNPLSILGEKFTIAGQLEGVKDKRTEEQLEAYKNGGTFVYGEDGATVVGIAEPNYDASGDGNYDTVVLYDENGEIRVTGDGIAVEDVIESNNNSDGEEFDIDIVDSSTTYTNTEDGVVETSTASDVTDGSNDSGDLGDSDNICEAGFEFDPVEGICMPIDTIGDGTKTTIKDRPIGGDGGGVTVPVVPRPTTGGVKIRTPGFNKGGVVTKNIDKFANGGVVTPNIDNFFGGFR